MEERVTTAAFEVTLREATLEDAEAIATVWHQGWLDAHIGHVPDSL